MADAELWLEIYNAIGCDEVTRDDIGEYCIDSLPIRDRAAHDLIAMHAIRWLGDRCWDTVFKHEGKTVIGDSSPFQKWICEESKARALLRAIRCQLERVADNG